MPPFLKYEKVKIEGVKERRLRRILTIRDNYFSESALQKLNELWGLRLFSFDVIIEVSKDIIKNYDLRNRYMTSMAQITESSVITSMPSLMTIVEICP